MSHPWPFIELPTDELQIALYKVLKLFEEYPKKASVNSPIEYRLEIANGTIVSAQVILEQIIKNRLSEFSTSPFQGIKT